MECDDDTGLPQEADVSGSADAACADLRTSLEASDAPGLVVELPASALGSASQTLVVRVTYTAGSASGGLYGPAGGSHRQWSALAAACATCGEFAYFSVRASRVAHSTALALADSPVSLLSRAPTRLCATGCRVWTTHSRGTPLSCA